ncbi:unnamed protein product [Discula destructiva]
MEIPPPSHRGDASLAVRYNPVPIGGPDRPPVNHSPSPGTIYASSPGRRGSHLSRRTSSGRTGLHSPNVKRERAESEYASEPPSAVTDQSEHSSTAFRDGRDDDLRSQDADGDGRKRRQKRNKPTLSCFECVERKTKCDRGRPNCLACIKRQTECKYAEVANLLEETSRASASGRRTTKPPKKKPGPSNQPRSAIPNIADRGVLSSNNYLSRAAVALSTGLLSNIPYSMATGSNIFGIASVHPFSNIWTNNWRIDEVIVMMPNRETCDVLVTLYFDCVDPVYPMLHRQSFRDEYEHFWSLSIEARCAFDPAFVALLFVIYGLGTQFRVTSDTELASSKRHTAETYASAANQALRLASYLSIASIRSIQSMVLMVYFLINDNHASDGWAFAGILMRQAYAMGLHRDPNVATPDAPLFEKNERRKLWQAVLLQDTFLTVLLSLPPNATHTDVSVDDLFDELPVVAAAAASQSSTDTAYIRGSWTLANLVQESICSPRCLDMPICSTPRHKTKLVADFRAVYRAFPDTFRSWDADSLTALAQQREGGRAVRQTLFLTSNYFHNLMLVHASESPEVPVNVRATLEAAHEAMDAFFMLFSLFEQEARTWWVFSHRAFLEALCVGSVLREAAGDEDGEETLGRDQLFMRGRGDIARMVQIMNIMGQDEENGSDVARTRAQVLSEFL